MRNRHILQDVFVDGEFNPNSGNTSYQIIQNNNRTIKKLEEEIERLNKEILELKAPKTRNNYNVKD